MGGKHALDSSEWFSLRRVRKCSTDRHCLTGYVAKENDPTVAHESWLRVLSGVAKVAKGNLRVPYGSLR